MKIQTSLEFLVITGAIGVLMVSAIAQYSGLFAHAKQIPDLPYNYTLQSNETYFQRPYAEINIPASSSAGQKNEMEIMVYGCNNGTATISLDSNTTSFSPSKINSSFFSMQVWHGSFVPGNGTNNIYAKYTLACEGRSYAGSENLSTVSYAPGSPASPVSYSAYISGRNESIRYPMSNKSVYLLSISSFCSFRTWTGHPYTMAQQCGSSSWGYMLYSQRCQDYGDPTRTVCIVPYASGYNLQTPTAYGANYIYSANLSITGRYRLSTYLTSASSVSPVTYSGSNVGTASVINVSSQSSVPGIVVLSGSSTKYVNSTYAGQYQQARDNLEAMLSYYNNTILPIGESLIQQSENAYDNAESRLVTSATNSTKYLCSVQGSGLDCRSASPFYYTVVANISSSYVAGNQALSYAGSAILVNN